MRGTIKNLSSYFYKHIKNILKRKKYKEYF